MALKIDGKEEYALLVNENRFNGELNSKDRVIEFLSNSYLAPIIQKQIGIVENKQEDVKLFVKNAEQIDDEKYLDVFFLMS